MPPKRKRVSITINDASEAADGLVELRTIRDALNVTKPRERAMRDAIMKWLDEQHQESLYVEGEPLLKLRSSERYEYDLVRLATDDPSKIAALASAGCLTLSIGALRKAVEAGTIDFGTREYRTPKVTRSLVFEDEPEEE